MKNIKKMLKEQACGVLPDGHVKENIKRELGLAETERSLAPAHGGEIAAKDRRKWLIPLIAGALAAALLLGILLPLFLRKSGSVPNLPLDNNKFAEITDADSFYAYGAASVGALLAASGTASEQALPAAKALSVNMSNANAAPSDDARIDVLNRYMSLVEGLLSEGAIDAENVTGAYGYEFGMTVTLGNLLGGGAVYSLYYDKIYRSGKQEGEEREESYAIRGLLVTGDAQYPVEGNYETETEWDEAESELYFKAFTNDTNLSYIEVEQEYESEGGDEAETEKEYVYSVYERGALIERTIAEYEQEDGSLELLLTIEREGLRETLQFRSGRESGESVLYADGTIDGERVRFTVYIREGLYHYVFDDGSYSDHDRYDDDDNDDDDDDDRFDDD